MRLSGIRAKFRRKRETGRHRGEPRHPLGPLIVIGTGVALLCTAIVTVFIVQGSPEPAAVQYHPSYNPTPPPHVFPPQQPSPAASTYTVVAGDNLWTIAYRQCGDGNKWQDLQHANGIDPWWLHPGQVLKLPAPACA